MKQHKVIYKNSIQTYLSPSRNLLYMLLVHLCFQCGLFHFILVKHKHLLYDSSKHTSRIIFIYECRIKSQKHVSSSF